MYFTFHISYFIFIITRGIDITGYLLFAPFDPNLCRIFVRKKTPSNPSVPGNVRICLITAIRPDS